MSSQFNICLNPFESTIQYAEDLVFHIRPPYDKSKVTVDINPACEDYIPSMQVEDGQITQYHRFSTTDETLTIHLDLQTNPEQHFAYNGKRYSLRFMGFSRKTIQGQDFDSFDFYIDILELTDFQKEGTITFKFQKNDQENTDKKEYRKIKEVLIQPSINQENIFVIFINGPLGQSLVFRTNILENILETFDVAITWKDNAVRLYLNGELAQEKKI